MIERFLLSLWHLLIGWGGLILGGIYGTIRGFDEVLKAGDALFFRFRDYAVFEIIDQPMRYPYGLELNWKFWHDLLEKDYRYGYTPEAISEILNRSRASVMKSLKRLKRTDKAVETVVGWFSRRTAPQD